MSYPPSHHLAQKFDLFTRKLKEADSFLKQWQDIKTAIVAMPENGYSEQLNATAETIETAITDFKNKLAHPTLTLAVTGTTSSGKSSLINLLCGADIMPCFEKETSAGIVTIHHATTDKCELIIHKTQGATWQCGSWADLSDSNIQEKLTACMETYNKHRTDANPPEFPKIDLTYPIACFTDKSLLGLQGLPDSTQFKLLDLPGLKNVTDTLNKEVIKHCKEALCLVTYNMAEADDIKRKTLVKEVLEQVKLMGGSPNRMVFVLNRIDQFNKDDHAERIKNEQVTIVLNEIKSILAESLPQYQHQLETLSYSRLSSLPSLYAYWLRPTHPQKRYAANQLDNDFKRLTPAKEEFKKRSIRLDESEDWQADDFTWVHDYVWQSSHADDFFQVLDDHIEAHFAALVLPPMIEDLKGKISFSVGEWLRLANAEIAETEEECEDALTALKRQDEELTAFLDLAACTLTNSLTGSSTLQNKCHELLTHYPYTNLPNSSLAPLYLWAEDIRNEMNGILEKTWELLCNGNCTGTYVANLGRRRQSLEIVCGDFKSMGYPIFGDKIRATSDEEKRNFNNKKMELQKFAYDLGGILTEQLNKITVPQLLQRIEDVLEKLQVVHFRYLQSEINKIVPQWGLSLPARASLTRTFSLSETEICLTAPVQSEQKEERSPWWLWLAKRTVEYGHLPAITELDELFTGLLQKEQDETLTPNVEAIILSYFSDLNNSVKKEQQAVYANFKVKYQHRQEEIEQGKKSAQAPWLALLPSIANWQSDMQNLTDIRKLNQIEEVENE